MARALWKGAITFGLVHVPVELFPAEDRKEFHFSMLDKRDLAPVGYKRFNKRSGAEVEWDDIIKGYEYEKDSYVVLSDEDFRRANVKASEAIEIQAFVPANQIAPQYFATPYYLAPIGRGGKGYALLRETLRVTQRFAIAQVVIRTTQHLAAVLPVGDALMLNTLRYAKELHPVADFDLASAGAKAGLSAKELELAKRLVDDMTEDWRAAKFKDTFHEDLMRRIEEKIRKGQTREITEPDDSGKAQRRSAEIIDLAALLRDSLVRGDRKPARRASHRRSIPKNGRAAGRGRTHANPHATAVAGQRRAPARRKHA